ncbi:coat protein [Colletotrichum caudatum totivirus 1]|nr:coat protein [Colletotrichum caudatum totivirus 1]
MANATASTLPSLHGLLVGGLAGESTGLIPDDNTYRRYRTGISIGVFEHGSYTYKRRSIFYEVGRRYARVRDALAYEKDNVDILQLDASVPVNPTQAANFEGWARKFSNFSPQWEMMDLCGIVERLAKGVASQSVFGGVNSVNLRGGQPLRVVALGTLDAPQTASNSSVFIPRTIDTVTSDNVFAVLVGAANGEGATVTTDVLRLDPNNNSPVVPSVGGQPFAQACVEALRILGANFEESGAGDLFAYAVTRGVHAIVSTVGHTDEGSWFRHALRSCTFRVPYGGINEALRDYPALPPLAGNSSSATSAWVDNIALKTAALVAHCDPCVVAQGGTYPTVFTSSQGAISPPGTADPQPGDADARSVSRQIAGDLGRFTPAYCAGLVRLFGRSTDSGVAQSHLRTAAAHMLDAQIDRHLTYKTVAPYFWIEPTSLIPPGFLGSTAEMAGFGAIAGVGVETPFPTFERLRELDRGAHANFSTIAFKMRTARTSGLVCAWAAEPATLSGLRLYQFDEDSVILAGDQGPTAGDVPTKHAAADPLSSYLWTRGQSCIPPPAEFMNIQGNYTSKYKVVDWDDDFNATLDDLPEPWELEEHPTRWRSTVPTAIPAAASNAADSGARRARARASIALAQATLRRRGFGDAVSPVITVSNVPYQFEEAPHQLVTTATETHDANPGAKQGWATGNNRNTEPPIRGGPMPPVPHHQPLRGAPYPRVGGGQLAGGGGPGPAGPRPPPAPPSSGEGGLRDPNDLLDPASRPPSDVSPPPAAHGTPLDPNPEIAAALPAPANE